MHKTAFRLIGGERLEAGGPGRLVKTLQCDNNPWGSSSSTERGFDSSQVQANQQLKGCSLGPRGGVKTPHSMWPLTDRLYASRVAPPPGLHEGSLHGLGKICN